MNTKLVLALDICDIELAKKYVKELHTEIDFFKIGSQFFTLYGPEAVKAVTEAGGKVFLDLKYHDIPNTVEKAARAVMQLGVSIFNIHAMGGIEMMERTVIGVKEESHKLSIEPPVILAVTVLTSTSQKMYNECFRTDYPLSETILFFCSQAKKAGLDGVVASPMEVELIKENIGRDFKVLTPGIRPVWSETGDQKRFTTPGDAVRKGSDYIVIGRPILNSQDPIMAVKKIREEMETS